LMSYFVSNPSEAILQEIFEILAEFKGAVKVTLESVIECIKEDLRNEYGVDHPKVLIACDEVGKSDNEKKVVSDLCNLIDGDIELECFFTGLTLNPFDRESNSGRSIKNVPLPLLTFNASLALLQSFINGTGLNEVSTKLARLSGGHPRTIEAIDTIITNRSWNALQWNDTMFETVVDFASRAVSTGGILTEAEIMFLLRPKLSTTDIMKEEDLNRALKDGKLYATISKPSEDNVELLTSPMLLRSSLLTMTAKSKTSVVISYLNEMLDILGLRDLKEFRLTNAKQDGKSFEGFYLRMECLRRALQSEVYWDLIYVEEFYPSVTYSQNCGVVRFDLVPEYTVENITCNYDFPSKNSADAASIAAVKAILNANSIDKVIYPSKKNQAAYDFFFILKDYKSGSRFVQLVDSTFAAVKKNKSQLDSDSIFINRVVNKLKGSEKLAWSELGVGEDDIVHTFVSARNGPPIDWAKELAAKNLSHKKVIILEMADLQQFYGPMLNALFACVH